MDPYLEDPEIWEDFHARLATETSDQLAPRLRPRYIAAITRRVSYEEVSIAETQPQSIRPDVSVVRMPQTAGPRAAVAEAATETETETIAPAPLVIVDSEVNLYGIEIREVKTGSLVTAIEILSPVNKRLGHEAFAEYQRKRRNLRRAHVHLLEIDLLRVGERALTADLPEAPYFIFLTRAGHEDTEIWPVALQQPIPVVPVPLLKPDPDVPLNLNRALQSIYDRAAYDLRVDYARPVPRPPLPPADQQWLAAHLQAAGAR